MRTFIYIYIYTLLGITISPQKGTFEDDFPFPKVGYVGSLECIAMHAHYCMFAFGTRISSRIFSGRKLSLSRLVTSSILN